MILEDDEIIPEYICRESVQAMNLDELRALLYPRTKTMKELKPMKTCKSSKILADDHILPEGLTMEEWQVISLEQVQRVLYPRTITMDELRCQDDQVKSSTSDKKPHCCETRADASERTTTSEKGPSKLLACMATP